MKLTPLTLFSAGVLTIIACLLAYGYIGGETRPSTQLEGRLGASCFDSIRNTTYFVLKQQNGESIYLSDAQMDQLIFLTLKDSSYLFDYKKKCVFVPEYEIQMGHDTNLIQFSPSGNQLRFVTDGKHITFDYDPIKDKMTSFLKSLHVKEL